MIHPNYRRIEYFRTKPDHSRLRQKVGKVFCRVRCFVVPTKTVVIVVRYRKTGNDDRPHGDKVPRRHK